MTKRSILQNISIGLILIWLTAFAAYAQVTMFTYQGKLNTSGSPATGPYEMQFQLFDRVKGGTQIGPTITDPNVVVINGILTTTLDFGAAAFDGSSRFLEIGVRPAKDTNPFTILGPRQPVTSAPYSIRSLNAASADTATTATQLGGIDASQYVTVTSGTTNSIPVWDGAATLGDSLITQSGGAVQLPASVSLAQTASGNNIVFGSPNSETGMSISGATGRADIRFDGTTLRMLAGPAGGPPSVGVAVNSNGVQLPNGVQLGAGAQGNNVSFGSPNSETGMTISGTSGRADLRYDGTLKLLNGSGGIPAATSGIAITTSGNVGIGTTTPTFKLQVAGSVFASGSLDVGNGIGVTNGLSIGSGNLTVNNSATIGSDLTVNNKITTNSLRVNSGGFSFATVAGSYTQDICRDIIVGTLGQCGTSLRRYKTNVEAFKGGLDIVNRLRPVSFTWKESGQRDVGFIAEEVFAIEPLLTTSSESGELQGVKYRQLGIIFVNAIKQQQIQIEDQRQQIEALTRLVCSQNRQAEICREK